MIEDWPTAEESEAAIARGCTCGSEGWRADPARTPGRDAYCVEHGDRMIMRATIDKLRREITIRENQA